MDLKNVLAFLLMEIYTQSLKWIKTKNIILSKHLLFILENFYFSNH